MPHFHIKFLAVNKSFHTGLVRRQSIHALRDVSFAVPTGSVFGLIGPNRAGKTTLIKSLLSICRPTSGTIMRLGKPSSDRSTLARVGYVHESPAFPRYLTAKSLLQYYGRLSLVSDRELSRRIPQLLERVGLADRAREPIATFSKGMTQRLALAQALVNDPELLVLDEPTEGMDLLARKLLDEVIHQQQQAGKTTLLVSHNLADVERLCDRMAVLQGGRLTFDGAVADLVGKQGASAPRLAVPTLQGTLEPMYSGAIA